MRTTKPPASALAARRDVTTKTRRPPRTKPDVPYSTVVKSVKKPEPTSGPAPAQGTKPGPMPANLDQLVNTSDDRADRAAERTRRIRRWAIDVAKATSASAEGSR